MPEWLKQLIVIFVFFGLPGLAGAWLAGTKGRSRLGWFLLCFFFPPTLMVAIFQGPVREVPGHCRRCPKCNEYIKWRETACKYCGAPIFPEGA
jgi:hypothetical protein